MATLAFERETERPTAHLTEHLTGQRPQGSADGPGDDRRGGGLLTKVTIKQKLWAMAAIAIAVFLVMTAIGLLRVGPSIGAVKDNAATTTAITEMSAAYTNWVSSDDDVQSALSGTPIESEAPGTVAEMIDDLANDYADATKHLDAAIAAAQTTQGAQTTAAVKGLESLKKLVAAYHDDIEVKAITELQAGHTKAAARVAMIGGNTMYTKVDDGFQKMSKLAKQVTAERTADIDGKLSSLRLSLAVVAIIGALLFIAVAFFIIGSITRPLQRVVEVLRSIASGDR
ncbi:HAMP domain-containing protein [Nocardioides sp. Iso805N]|uniref:HAMP domain-containing protein n=1 Tax=Nocardioides sp. Iso805N TaxID=1283287 RepID=UPI00036FC9D4|nr:HAMP domain-containing protein [Nocardioides sp. Iso805N]